MSEASELVDHSPEWHYYYDQPTKLLRFPECPYENPVVPGQVYSDGTKDWVDESITCFAAQATASGDFVPVNAVDIPDIIDELTAEREENLRRYREAHENEDPEAVKERIRKRKAREARLALLLRND